MIKEKEAEIERLRASNSAADQAALKQQLSATEEELNELKEELSRQRSNLPHRAMHQLRLRWRQHLPVTI